MKKLFSFLLISFLAACGSGDSHTPEGPRATLYFTAIPDQDSSELTRKFGAVAQYLQHTLGVPVKYLPSTSYAASVEMFRRGDVDLAWFGGLTGVQARSAVKGAHAIVQGAEDRKFRSYFIANRSTGLKPTERFPEMLSDIPFAFGDPQSTSGRLMPAFYIKRETGQAPRVFFKHSPAFSGSHDKTLEWVRAGAAIKAGVLSYTVYDEALAQDPTLSKDVVVLWKTPEYADYNFTAHPALNRKFGKGFITKLQSVLVEMKNPILLTAFSRSAFVPATDSEYDAIAKIAQDEGFLTK